MSARTDRMLNLEKLITNQRNGIGGYRSREKADPVLGEEVDREVSKQKTNPNKMGLFR